MRGGWAERTAIILAVVFVAGLATFEFAVFRPHQARLTAAEADLKSLQDQLAGVARRNLADQELYRYAGTGTDGDQFRKLFSSESGLVYLTRLIQSSGLDRQGFSTEAGRQDGPYRVESYTVVLRGSFPRILGFLRSLEGGARLARVEQFKIEPVSGSPELVLGMRVAVYTLAGGG